MTKIVKVPLASTFSCRDLIYTQRKDPYILNGMIEQDGHGSYVVRRSGYNFFASTGGGSVGQGIFWFNGFFYIVFNDVLYRSSGTTFAGTSGVNWTQSQVPPWYGRTGHTMTTFDNAIYVIGGNGAFHYADVSSSNDGVTWTVNPGAAPFGSRAGHGAGVLGNQLFVVGGSQFILGGGGTTVLTNDSWSTPDGTNWTLVSGSSAFSARSFFSMVATPNGFYITGGADNNATTGLTNDVWFSSDANTWTLITGSAPWAVRSNHSGFWFNNKLWVVGGIGFGAVALNDVWSSSDGANWVQSTGSAFSTGQGSMASVVYNNKMWVMGGTNIGSPVANVYSSLDGTTWALSTSSATFGQRYGCAAVVFQTPYTVSTYRYQSIFLTGGYNGSTFLQDNWYGNIDTAVSGSYNLNPTITFQPYQFHTYQNGTQLLIKNQSNFWVFGSSVLTKVTDPNFPSVTVPGLAVLDAFAHVMTPTGQIFSCKFLDATQWPSIQNITAEYEDDPGVGLFKYLTFIVAFGQYTTQFFYDAANPEASELSVYPTANLRVGCVSAATIVSMNNTLFWLGVDENNARHVYIMDGMSPKQISTVFIDKWITETTISNMNAFPWVGSGHYCYVITDGTNCLAYDMSSGAWHLWTFFGSIQPPFYTTTAFDTTANYFISQNSAGAIYQIDLAFTTDNGNLITVGAQTPVFDDGITASKFWGRVTVVGNQVNGAGQLVDTILTTDDDYTTYVNRGTVDQFSPRPNLTRQGASRHRAWFITTTSQLIAFRWSHLEIEYSPGES